ncbi:MAG: hypothetical protein K6U89_04575 [Chloroflexi bacterium]|nr:hypothetical protein [Chloroflexota bacterium]
MAASALPALVTLLHGGVVLLQPTEALYGEGIVLGQALAVATGRPLYPPLGEPPYSVTAYPPLYYLAVATLLPVTGPSLVPGRLLSLAALALAAALVALAVTPLAGGRWGLLAASLFLAQPAAAEWAGLHRVDSLALAFALAGLLLASRSRLGLAALALTLSVLTKQTYLAAPLAVPLWLVCNGRWREAARFSVTVLGLVSGGVLLLQHLSDGQFLRHIVGANLNPYFPTLVLAWLGWAAVVSGPLLLGAVLGLIVLPRRWLLWKLYLLASLPNILALGKEGASFNYWFEPLAAAAVLTAGVLALLLVRWPRLAAASAVALLVTLLPAAAATARVSSAAVVQAGTDRPHVEQAVQFVRDVPGEVLSEDLAIPVLAGKPVAFEYVIFTILWAEGAWSAEPLIEDVAAGRYPYLLLLGDDDPLAGDCRCFPPPVWQALQQHYQREDHLGRFVVYRFKERAELAAR